MILLMQLLESNLDRGKMIKDYITKQLKLNAELAGHPSGSIIPIRTDKDGIPLDRYWRDRVKDAKIDDCVKILSKKELEEMQKVADKLIKQKINNKKGE